LSPPQCQFCSGQNLHTFLLQVPVFPCPTFHRPSVRFYLHCVCVRFIPPGGYTFGGRTTFFFVRPLWFHTEVFFCVINVSVFGPHHPTSATFVFLCTLCYRDGPPSRFVFSSFLSLYLPSIFEPVVFRVFSADCLLFFRLCLT